MAEPNHVLRGRAPFYALPACKDTAVSSLVAAELWTGGEKSNRPDKAGSLETFLSLFKVVDFGGEVPATTPKSGRSGNARARPFARSISSSPPTHGIWAKTKTRMATCG